MYFLSDGVALHFTKTKEKSKKQKGKSKRQKAKSKSAGVTQEVRMYFLSDAQILNSWEAPLGVLPPSLDMWLEVYIIFKSWRHSRSTYVLFK